MPKVIKSKSVLSQKTLSQKEEISGHSNYRVENKILLACYALLGVRGEISMALSLAESWEKQGKKNFHLGIYFSTAKAIIEKRHQETFARRYKALAKKGIQVTIFSSDGLIVAQYHPDYKAKTRVKRTVLYSGRVMTQRIPRKTIKYISALVYPFPYIRSHKLDSCQCSLETIYGKEFAGGIVVAFDIGNLKPNRRWIAARGLKTLELEGEKYKHLKLLQPPSHVDVSRLTKPVFIGDKPYYLMYVNPDLVPTDRASHEGVGPDYHDAFLLFAGHSRIKHPGKNIRIYYNGQKTAARHDLGRIAGEILKCYSEVGRVTYQVYDNDSKAYASKTIQATDLGRDGGITIEIRFHPNLPHDQFLWLMKHAECLVANASGCLDEAFSMRKPCFIYDNWLMTRIPNLLEIIKEEQVGRPSQHLKYIEAFLKAHQDLSLARQVGCEAEAAVQRERLLAFFTESRLVGLLEGEFSQLVDLISSKYQLSPALYDAIESLAPSDTAEGTVSGVAAASSGAITTESVSEVKAALLAMIEEKISGGYGAAAFFASSAGHTRRDGQHLLNYLNGKEEKITKDEIPEWLRESMEQFAQKYGFKDSTCLLEVLKPEAPSQAATPG